MKPKDIVVKSLLCSSTKSTKNIYEGSRHFHWKNDAVETLPPDTAIYVIKLELLISNPFVSFTIQSFVMKDSRKPTIPYKNASETTSILLSESH